MGYRIAALSFAVLLLASVLIADRRLDVPPDYGSGPRLPRR